MSQCFRLTVAPQILRHVQLPASVLGAHIRARCRRSDAPAPTAGRSVPGTRRFRSTNSDRGRQWRSDCSIRSSLRPRHAGWRSTPGFSSPRASAGSCGFGLRREAVFAPRSTAGRTFVRRRARRANRRARGGRRHVFPASPRPGGERFVLVVIVAFRRHVVAQLPPGDQLVEPCLRAGLAPTTLAACRDHAPPADRASTFRGQSARETIRAWKSGRSADTVTDRCGRRHRAGWPSAGNPPGDGRGTA